MGRRKVNSINKKTQKNTSKSKKAPKTFSTDLLGGFTVVLGFIMLVFLGFSNIGFIADLFKNISKGFFGSVSYLVPIIFIVTGIYVIVSDNKVNITKQILKGLLLVSLISILVASCVYKYENINSGIIKLIVDSYNNATTGTNISGFVGSIISMMIISLIGKVATIILFSFVTFITTLCVFNLSFKQFFNGVAGFFKCLFNLFSYICSILFRNDENDEEDYEDDEDISEDSVNIQNNTIKGNKKIRKSKNFALEKNSIEIDEMLEEKGTKNVDDNIKISSAEQLEFDINKLGVKPSKEEIEAKQQRDQFFKKQKEQKEDKSVKEVLTIDHAELIEQDNYEFPSIELLTKPKEGEEFDKRIIRSTALKLQKTLASFGVEAKVTNITKGPTVTRYELTPSTGVKVSKIVNLSDDIALNLEAKSIRIEAPIPGKAAVGIEVPNKISESVLLREVIDSQKFADHSSKLAFALGKDAAGEIAIGDIAKMPHVLIAGATGSGKSVCINSILVSLLYKAKPSEVKLILIDPKMVELSGYNGIPHLLIPVVTDPKKAAGALNWAVQEMVKRYGLFASAGVKDLKGYNKIIEQKEGAKLPQIVIIVDELADLMMVAPNDVEDAICRLAQMARAAGMHLVIATQRPSVDVITGIIKANIPSRIAFTVSSQVDSRTILDMAGAEKLLGKGDMLYFPVGETKPLRIQGTFISESEIDKIVEEIKSNNNSTYSEDIIESIEKSQDSKNGNNSNETGDDADSLLEDAIDLVVDLGQASASMLQRRFKIGYSRAGRIVDQMEARGLISGYEGSKPRQVLVSKEEWQELKMGNANNSLDNSENNSESFNNTSNVGYDSDNIVKAEVSRLENENKTKYDVQT